MRNEPAGYRPPIRLTRLVRVRDRRCRFPGCTVAAVFCDIDHVRPWPSGPTSAENLMCLCRRHHRVKQRPGWRVVLDPDGTATWTDPTGRVRTTTPADALHATVLHGGAGIPMPAPSTSRARTVLPDGPHSALEFHLEHLGAHRDEPRKETHTTRARDSQQARRTSGRGPGSPGRRHAHLSPPIAVIRVAELCAPLDHGATRRLSSRMDRRREPCGDEDLPPF